MKGYEQKMLIGVLLIGLPGYVLGFTLLWKSDLSFYLQLLVSGVGVLFLIGSIQFLMHKVLFNIRTLSNLIEAIRSEDFSLRGRRGRKSGEMGELFAQINALSDELQQQRLQAKEAQVLLKKVVEDVDIAIAAIDENDKIVFKNPRFEWYMNLSGTNSASGDNVSGNNVSSENISSNEASQSFVQQLQAVEYQSVVETKLPDSKISRMMVKRDKLKIEGKFVDVFFLTDIDKVLYQEQIESWRKLIRVISHEVNNSLTPIASIASTLAHVIHPSHSENELQLGELPMNEIQVGLSTIEERANSLQKFIEKYSTFAKLPVANRKPIENQSILTSLQSLYQYDDQVTIGHQLNDVMLAKQVYLDWNLIQQGVINLVKNAKEAAPNKKVSILVELADSRESVNDELKVRIRDYGQGIQNLENIFTPFYTTKASGSGIGLYLSKMLIESQNGSLDLVNRQEDGIVSGVDQVLTFGLVD